MHIMVAFTRKERALYLMSQAAASSHSPSALQPLFPSLCIKPFHFSLLSFFPSLLCFLPPLSVVPLLIWAFSLFHNIEEMDVFGSRCNYCHLLRAETLYLCGFPVLQVSARSRGGAFSPRSWRGARCESRLCVIARAGRGQCGRRWVAEATRVVIVWGTPGIYGMSC